MDPIRPDYEGPNVRNILRALRGGAGWTPDVLRGSSGVVLLVLDGLPWNVLDARRSELPNLATLRGGPITTVVPSTTPTALLSITTGLTPGEHGIVGYRILLDGRILNVLRWSIHGGGTPPEPDSLQPREAFGGEPIPVVTRAAFRRTKFTQLQLRGADFHGWSTTSELVERCGRLRSSGERFVYAYYDGLDVVAHIHGMRDAFFTRELVFCDALVGELLDTLDGETALVVTADHGHVHFDERVGFEEHAHLIANQSGESRFRYLHAHPGAERDLYEALATTAERHSWVFTRERLIDEGWYGITPRPEVARRIGDVVVAAREAVGFLDPENPGEARLLSGHGSLTSDEMHVPLLAGRGRA